MTNPTNLSPDGLRDETGGDRLPAEAPRRMWGGQGSGAPCAICGHQIAGDQLEYELEYVRAGQGAAAFHVHVHCCAQWELERMALRLSR